MSNLYPGTKPLPTSPPSKAATPEVAIVPKEYKVAMPSPGADAKGKCRPGEHDYSCLGFPDGLVLMREDGHRFILAFCSRCADEHVINLTAHGIPRCTLPSAR